MVWFVKKCTASLLGLTKSLGCKQRYNHRIFRRPRCVRSHMSAYSKYPTADAPLRFVLPSPLMGTLHWIDPPGMEHADDAAGVASAVRSLRVRRDCPCAVSQAALTCPERFPISEAHGALRCCVWKNLLCSGAIPPKAPPCLLIFTEIAHAFLFCCSMRKTKLNMLRNRASKRMFNYER